jgi:flagellar FliL protein
MSAAAAAKAAPDASAADGAPAAAPARGKKKLIVIAAALAVLLAGGGGAAFFMMKKRAAAAAAAEEEDGAEGSDKAGKAQAKLPKADVKNAPAFVPLDPFTVNLADREAERYAQVGMTLELADPKAGDLLKAYMPAIRNNILLALSSKTAAQLMEHDGKVLLAEEVRAAALKPLGYAIKAPAQAASGVKKAAAKGHEDEDAPPIRAVHFSNFIIQ